MAPWNVVSKGGLPIGLIDWEYAGLIDSLVEVAQAAWLNVRLFGDDVAKIEGL
jgi:aminoglycoside phosphotransferase (APT) family kinase protein